MPVFPHGAILRKFVLARNLQLAGMQDMSLAEEDINSRLVSDPGTSKPKAIVSSHLHKLLVS